MSHLNAISPTGSYTESPMKFCMFTFTCAWFWSRVCSGHVFLCFDFDWSCCWKIIRVLKGVLTLSIQLFFPLCLRVVQFLSSKHPLLSPLVRKLQIFFFSFCPTSKIFTNTLCCAAEMESIESKWPREQPWWLSAAASDQLAAFKIRLSWC